MSEQNQENLTAEEIAEIKDSIRQAMHLLLNAQRRLADLGMCVIVHVDQHKKTYKNGPYTGLMTLMSPDEKVFYDEEQLRILNEGATPEEDKLVELTTVERAFVTETNDHLKAVHESITARANELYPDS